MNFTTAFTVTVESDDEQTSINMIAALEESCCDISNSYEGHVTVDEINGAAWTVMLLPPDYVADHNQTEPFLVHVSASSRSDAFAAAIEAAKREFMIGEGDLEQMEPSDWRLLLICRGYIVNEVEGEG